MLCVHSPSLLGDQGGEGLCMTAICNIGVEIEYRCGTCARLLHSKPLGFPRSAFRLMEYI